MLFSARRIALISLLFGCEQQAILDASVPDTGATEIGIADASSIDMASPDLGGDTPKIRRLIEHSIVPPGELMNRVLVPDFETKLPNGSWFAFSLDPNEVPPPLQVAVHWDTPSDRRELIKLPGTNIAPAGLLLVGQAIANTEALDISVWIGVAIDADFDNVESALFAYVPDVGPQVIDIFGQPSSDQIIGALRWRQYGGLLTTPLVGRLWFVVQNTSAQTISVNAPRIVAAQALAGNSGARSPTPAELERFQRFKPPLPGASKSVLDLPPHLSGRHAR